MARLRRIWSGILCFLHISSSFVAPPPSRSGICRPEASRHACLASLSHITHMRQDSSWTCSCVSSHTRFSSIPPLVWTSTARSAISLSRSKSAASRVMTRRKLRSLRAFSTRICSGRRSRRSAVDSGSRRSGHEGIATSAMRISRARDCRARTFRLFLSTSSHSSRVRAPSPASHRPYSSTPEASIVMVWRPRTQSPNNARRSPWYSATRSLWNTPASMTTLIAPRAPGPRAACLQGRYPR
jgi:hypothetical protein